MDSRSKLNPSKGGTARARSLSPEERSEIARRAAEARWAKEGHEPLPRATHTGSIRIGEIEIPCAVLDDGRRVLSEHGIAKALGGRSGASKRAKTEGRAPLPLFLAPKRLEPFVSTELRVGLLEPVRFRSGDRAIQGFPADLFPAICNVWLDARAAKRLQPQQERRAQYAEILMRGLAEVGIVALVDEATGYQDERERNALAKILEEFIAKELRAWVKTFPPDFYKEMFRLRDLPYSASSVRKPKYFGHLTNNVVYDRLAPGVRKTLKDVTPRNSKGRHKHQLHRRLSEDTGHPKLKEHLASVIGIMKGYDDWDSFIEHLDRAHPKYGDTPFLPFGKANSESDID